MIKIMVDWKGVILELYWYVFGDVRMKVDCFGKRGGYCVYLVGDGYNELVNVVFY